MSRERLLIRTLLELADTLIADYDVVDFLYLLCDRAVELVDADAAGVLLMNASGALEVAAASSHEMRTLEQVEADAMRGPCVEAHRSGRRVDAGDVTLDRRRWPEVADEAGSLGFHGVHADPLSLRGRPIGALNVYRRTAGPFTDDDAAVVAGLAGMAAIGIVNERTVSDAETESRHLQRALDKRTVVDQATAVLAERLGSDHDFAFHRLRRYARSNNQQLRDVADRFMAGDLDAGAIASAVQE